MKTVNKIVYYLCIVLVILTIFMLLVHVGKSIDSRCICNESQNIFN